MMIVDDDADRAWEHIVGRMAFQASDEELAEAEATLAEVEDAEPLSPRLIESIVAQAEGECEAVKVVSASSVTGNRQTKLLSWGRRLAAAALLGSMLALGAAVFVSQSPFGGRSSISNLTYSGAVSALRDDSLSRNAAAAALSEVKERVEYAIRTMRKIRDDRLLPGVLSAAAREAIDGLAVDAVAHPQDIADIFVLTTQLQDASVSLGRRVELVKSIAALSALGMSAIRSAPYPMLEQEKAYYIRQLVNLLRS